jgi:hypothetical protein
VSRLFWLGVGLVALAGIAAALLGPWWAAVADGLILLGLLVAARRVERHQWREGWWRNRNGHEELGR